VLLNSNNIAWGCPEITLKFSWHLSATVHCRNRICVIFEKRTDLNHLNLSREMHECKRKTFYSNPIHNEE
jgi:hypothetical protein